MKIEFEPTPLALWVSVLTITPPGLPDVINQSIPPLHIFVPPFSRGQRRLLQYLYSFRFFSVQVILSEIKPN